MNSLLNTISFNPASSLFDPNYPTNGKAQLGQKLEKSLEKEGKDENTKNQAEKKEADRQRV